MRVLLLFFAISFFAYSGFSQKIKIKDGFVLVDDAQWCKVDRQASGTKNYLSTLAGEEFVSVIFLTFGTGSYDRNGQEIVKRYCEINFFKTDLGIFEVDEHLFKNVLEMMYLSNILVDGNFNLENTAAFKTKHSRDVTGTHYKTK